MANWRYKYFQPGQAAQLRRLELTVRGVVEGVYAGLHKSPHKGFSIEFAEHREYVPGDEIKHVDWTVLARTDRHYVKQYEQETNLRATICLDASASMGYGATSVAVGRGAARQLRKGVTKWEYGCVLAASLAYLLSTQQDVVGLAVFDEQIRLEVPQGNGPLHLDEMFKRLETVLPGKGTQVDQALHTLAAKIPRRGLVILISDLYDEPEKLFNALQHLRHARHQLIVLQVLDPTEVDLPHNQPVTFQDMENASRLQIDPKLIQQEYRKEVQAFLDETKRKCGEFQIDYVLAFTDVPWDVQIREVLRRTGAK